MTNCCKVSNKAKSCTRITDKKKFSLPRRFSKKKCLSGPPKGFTMKASCAPYSGCKSQKGGRKKKTRRKKAGSRPPTPYNGPIYHSYYALSLNDQLDINQTDVGMNIERLVVYPSSQPGSFTPNAMSDLANRIVQQLPEFTSSLEINGEMVDTRVNYLIMMLHTISPDSIMHTETLEPNMRTLYLQELERVRRALLREIRNTGYPMNSISENLHINIEETQRPATPLSTELEYTRDSDGTFTSVFPRLEGSDEYDDFRSRFDDVSTPRSPTPVSVEESLSRLESGIDNTDIGESGDIPSSAQSLASQDEDILNELGPVAETSFTLNEGPSFMSLSGNNPNLSFESDISAIENEPSRPSSRSSSFSDEDREVARFIFRDGRSRSNSRGSTSSRSTSGEPERRRGGRKKSYKKNKKSKKKNKTKRKRKHRS